MFGVDVQTAPLVAGIIITCLGCISAGVLVGVWLSEKMQDK
jgi:hypothetical protein